MKKKKLIGAVTRLRRKSEPGGDLHKGFTGSVYARWVHNTRASEVDARQKASRRWLP